jgi:hypothetical protein
VVEEPTPPIRGKIANDILPAKQVGIEVRPVRKLNVVNEGEQRPVDRPFD